MGLFSNLFSKQACSLCNTEVGALNRTKLKDGLYICKTCKKDTSAFFKAENYTLNQVQKHIEYMEKQYELYNKEFSSLPKDKIDRIVHLGSYGIAFADDIAMFEIITPETSKRSHKELFRYDQIKDFEVYGKENINTQSGGKKYSETGIRILMNCANDISNISSSKDAKKFMHPYACEFIIPVSRNVDSKDGGLAKHHLNRIFGRPEETLVGSIKEKFTGTKHQQTGGKAAKEAASALGSLIKGDKEKAKEKLNSAIETGLEYATENRSKYTKIADKVEKDFMGETFREFLEK